MNETNPERARRAKIAVRLAASWLFLCFCGVVYLSFNSKANKPAENAEVLKVAERLAVVARYGPGIDEATQQSIINSAVEIEPDETSKSIIRGELPENWQEAELSPTYLMMAKQLREPDESREAQLEEIATIGLARFGITGLLLSGLGLFGIVTLFMNKPEANQALTAPTNLDSWSVLSGFFGWHVFGFLGAGIISLALSGTINGFLLIMIAQSAIYLLMLLLLSQLKLRPGLKPFRSFSWAWVGRGYFLSLASVLVVNILVSTLSGDPPQSENPVLTLFAEAPLWEFVCLGLLVVVIGPFFEELMFRGWLFGSLQEHWGKWPALIVSAALFALIHGDAPALPALFVLGLIFGWLYSKSGSLWVPFLVHACWNATTFSLLIAVMP